MDQYNADNPFTFPFSTCEPPQKEGWLAQPYSVMFNLLGCIALVYFMSKTKRWTTFVLLFSLLLFELFHTFSHAAHMQGYINARSIHIIGYITLATIILVLSKHLKMVSFSPWFVILLSILFLTDFYALLYLPFLYFFSTFVTMFLLILVFFYPFLSTKQQRDIFIIIGVSFLAVIAIFNEKFNCQRLLQWAPGFPFHIFVESFGALGLFLLGKFFYPL